MEKPAIITKADIAMAAVGFKRSKAKGVSAIITGMARTANTLFPLTLSKGVSMNQFSIAKECRNFMIESAEG
jgi:hypothetical protein